MSAEEKESLLQAYGSRIWGRLESSDKHLTEVSNKEYALEALRQMIHIASDEISVYLKGDVVIDLMQSLSGALCSAAERGVRLRIVSLCAIPQEESYKGLCQYWHSVSQDAAQRFKLTEPLSFSFIEVDQRHALTFDDLWMLAINSLDLAKAAYDVVSSLEEIRRAVDK